MYSVVPEHRTTEHTEHTEKNGLKSAAICRRSVDRGDLQIVHAEIDGELSAMMDEMIDRLADALVSVCLSKPFA